jgi:hypothetical protein
VGGSNEVRVEKSSVGPKMKARNTIAWFATEQGRRSVFGGVCCLGIGIPSAHYLAHTFLLNKYKEIVQMYR